ncbi:hypothetical protein DFJ74DRAFT_681966 [Hyaloraphidium curvatum]|nr:hypothetical protein DFJ74DRAFT_681966 [Hyaloraphidium curvatum]
MPSENPAPSLAPPPPPPPPPPAVPPPPPPPPLASGTNAFPKLRRAPSGSARSDSSATLAEPTIGLRAAHSTSSLPSRVPLAFSEELALRIRERSLVRTEIKSPVAQRRLARERDGQARTRQEFVLDSMKRRIIERRDSFRVSGSESEGEGGMRKKAKSAAGSEDEWEELDRRVKRKGKKEKRRASTAKSPGKELKADLKAEDGVDEVTDMFGGMEFSVRCELAKAEDVEAREGPSFMLSSLAAIGGTVSEQ